MATHEAKTGGQGWVRWLNLVGDVMSFCSHTCVYIIYESSLEINECIPYLLE